MAENNNTNSTNNNNSTSLLFPHLCVDDDFSLMHVGTEMFSILVFSHVFNLLLKPLGQSGPISHMLAGVVLGPSCLSRIDFLKDTILQDSGKIYNQTVATFSRVIFMFLFGLQMDVPYLLRAYKLASWVAYSGAMVCSVLALVFAPVLYHDTQAQGNGIRFGLIMIMMLSSTSSPAVIKIASELRFDMSEIGRLAIFSSLINDISVLVGLSLMTTWGSETSDFWTMFKIGLLCSILLVAAIFLNMFVVKYLNQMNPHRKYLRNIEAVSLLLYIMCLAMYTELSGYNSIITCFFLGLFFPREGKTYRTLVHKLDYPTHNFILPIYFAYTGFQADLKHAGDLRSISIILLIVFLSIVGKLGGTFAASHHLKMSPRDGAILGLLLNTKGHVDVMIISLASERHKWSVQIFNLYIITVAINTIVVGPFLAILAKGERRGTAFKHFGLEWQSPDSELRIMTCVHAPRHVSTMVRLVAATTGTPNSSSPFGSLESPFTIYLMHLVDLTDKSSNDLLYHQQDLEEDDDDYGGNDELEINEYVDSFVADTRLPIHQIKTVAPFTTMHDDLCDTATHLRVKMILLPFHKHQRIDGKMENSKMGIRTTNQKLLRSAPCSIGILVDRGFSPIQITESDSRQQVAILFFGGPDDREALAYGSYMIMHSDVKVTVFRFLPATTKGEQQTGINMESNEEEEVLMEIMSPETEKDADEGFLTDFYNRYVPAMKVNYEEKCVENGKETMSVLKSMKDRYSLFIVGKGRGTSPLTTGMSDWEECPELGVVGDVLASSDFVVTGSVLIIQQHKSLKSELLDCESMR